MTPRARVLAWCAILAVAAAARLSSWGRVFEAGRIVLLGDSDPHYHVLRAERIIREFPALPTFDPTMNHPQGAVILWPPLFDLLIAGPGWLLGGTREALERVAVMLPVLVGLATLPLVAGLGAALLGPRAGLLAAAIVAVLPANVVYTILGRADQHCLELLVFCWIVLALLRAWRVKAPSFWADWRGSAVFGLGMTAAFWNWQGSGLYLLILLGFALGWHVLGRDETVARRLVVALAKGAAAGTAMLGLSLAVTMPRALGSASIMGVTGFHVLLVALTAASAVLLAASRAMWPGPRSFRRRLAEAGVATVLPLAVVLAGSPSFRDSVARGFTALAAANPWYAIIHEFQPMLFNQLPALEQVRVLLYHWGLVLLVFPLLGLILLGAWQARPLARPELGLVAYLGVVLVGLALWRYRFQLYAVVPVALWLALGLVELGDWISTRLGARAPRAAVVIVAAVACLLVAPAIWGLRPSFVPEGASAGPNVPLLRWLGEQGPAVPGRDGVLAPWNMGHTVRYYAGKPVVTSPFGTDGGQGAMAASAAFYLAPGPEAAEAALAARHIGWVLLGNPMTEINVLQGFAPWLSRPAVHVVWDWSRGATAAPAPAMWLLPASRLYYFDGGGPPGSRLPSLTGYRLLHDMAPATGFDRSQQRALRLFGVVPGAVLAVTGALPGSTVAVQVPVFTNTRQRFDWTAWAAVDGSGRAEIRVPYATGFNGDSRARAASVSAGEGEVTVEISESQVTRGETLQVRLPPPSRSPRPRG